MKWLWKFRSGVVRSSKHSDNHLNGSCPRGFPRLAVHKEAKKKNFFTAEKPWDFGVYFSIAYAILTGITCHKMHWTHEWFHHCLDEFALNPSISPNKYTCLISLIKREKFEEPNNSIWLTFTGRRAWAPHTYGLILHCARNGGLA